MESSLTSSEMKYISSEVIFKCLISLIFPVKAFLTPGSLLLWHWSTFSFVFLVNEPKDLRSYLTVCKTG